MNVKYQDFIGMYQNVYPDGFCNHMISEFERVRSNGYCGNRQNSENVSKTIKQDEFYFLNLKNHSLSEFNDCCSTDMFFDGLQQCFENYITEYDILKDIDIKCTSIKMQKSTPGSGYHVWHSEQGPGVSANRVLTYILYLNTLKDNAAGETEFLYQRLRIPPQENSMVIWPAAYTHTHRGNVVHGNDNKYIITGWFYVE
jgi:hypothetical protein